jgi:hypothetical protein
MEQAKRDADEKDKLLAKAQMSGDARKDYEDKEAERLKKDAERLG